MEDSAKKRKQKRTLQNAMRKFNAAEEYYAKIIIKNSSKTRLRIYRKIASLMHNRFSLMDAPSLRICLNGCR